jgi:sulfide dehydrogenase [flavocytochrome c] flavoprotein chain
VLDPKPTFAMQALFEEGWERHYPGMIEWQDPQMHGGVKGVDPKSMTIETDLASYTASLANVIPAQTAARIARDAGLADASGYCPIEPTTMKSSNDPGIYIVGDACIAGEMPKAASSANSQAKVAAVAIRGELIGAAVAPAGYAVTCWSLIEIDDAVKVGGRYEAKGGKISAVETFVSQTNEPAGVRRRNQEENMDWYAGIVADAFT